MKKDLDYNLIRCINHLIEGNVILYPTDTIWGLGGDATNAEAVDKIFEIKQRPKEKSLIVLVDTIETLERYVNVTNEIESMIFSFKVPTTVIYPNPLGLAKNAVNEDNTIAIRLVKHKFCQQLIREFGKPIISTSANISGEKTPLQFGQIASEIKEKVDFIVERKHDTSTYHQPSKLIRINKDNSIEYLR
jgi:L-threonylcarbamoyladenylate synthase